MRPTRIGLHLKPWMRFGKVVPDYILLRIRDENYKNKHLEKPHDKTENYNYIINTKLKVT